MLTLDADRVLFLGEAQIAPDGLAAALEAASGGDREARIFLRADEGLPYGALMGLLDALRGAGYLRVALVGLETPDASPAAAAP